MPITSSSVISPNGNLQLQVDGLQAVDILDYQQVILGGQ